MDRRIARTRRLLAQSLVELVNDQPYDSISIRDITEHADIGYATFFRHYEGKDDLMLDVFTRIITELEALQDSHNDDSFEQEGIRFFQHVADNASLYRSILDSNPFARKLRQHIAAMIQKHLEHHTEDLQGSTIPQDIAAQHMVSSVLGLIDWWIDNQSAYTIEQMGKFYEKLTVESTWHAMTTPSDTP